jgi:Zn finger protein HypA/HybF involved in hydrogenase expression
MIIQECEACGDIWQADTIYTRCPSCDSYKIIIDVEWDDVTNENLALLAD